MRTKKIVWAAVAAIATMMGGLATVPAQAVEPGGDTHTYIVDNSTGKTQDGTAMSAPGLKVGNLYYSIGSSAIAASAGGASNLVLYGGTDWTNKKPVLDASSNEIVIAGPQTHFTDPNTGAEVYPFSNSKQERVAFSETPNAICRMGALGDESEL